MPPELLAEGRLSKAADVCKASSVSSAELLVHGQINHSFTTTTLTTLAVSGTRLCFD